VSSEVKNSQGTAGEMRKRRTLMEDGRYLIYYTFGDEEEAPRTEGGGAGARPEPEAEPVAEEERRV